MAQTDTSTSAQPRNVRETVSVLSRLVPKQLNDELALTVTQLKSKGIAAGIAVALIVAGLVFVGLMVIALVVAAVAGLATVMPLWLAALLVALFFLIIGGVLAGVGAMRVKNVVPEVKALPSAAVRRVKHDIGVLTEGTSFDTATLVSKPKPQPVKAEDAKVAADGNDVPTPKPTEAELRRRLARRREHLADLRDTLGRQTDVKAKVGQFAQSFSAAGTRARDGMDRVQVGVSDAVTNQTQLRAAAEKVGPWALLAGAVTTFFVLLRKVFRKSK